MAGAYEFDDLRLRRHAPTLTTRASMAALVPRVDVEAEGGHVAIISGQPRRRKGSGALERLLQNLIGNYKIEGARLTLVQDL